MEIKIVDKDNKPIVKSTPETKEVKNEVETTGSTSLPELEMRAVHQALGLENDGDKNRFKHEVDTILRWAQENAKGKDPEDLKWAIRSLELRVGTPPLSENRVRYLARYAFLAGEHKNIEKQLKAFQSMI